MVVLTSLWPSNSWHGADVGARLQQVGGEAVAQGMGGDAPVDARSRHRPLDRALQALFIQVVAAHDVTVRIGRERGRGKHPEPAPRRADLRVLGLQCIRHLHAAALGQAIALPKCTRRQHLRAQVVGQRAREHHHAVLVAFGLANDDGAAVEIDVLGAQPQRLHQAHAGAIEKACHQSYLSGHQ